MGKSTIWQATPNRPLNPRPRHRRIEAWSCAVPVSLVDGESCMPTSEQIKFACPNGHPLSCPREMIGKPGKCPKCNSRFVVPDIPDDDEEVPEEAAEQESGGGFRIDTTPPANRGKPGAPAPTPARGPAAPATLPFAPAPAGKAPVAGSSKGGAEGSGKLTVAGTGIPADADLIVFLCPNGHRLNGPKKLQGKPGKCPHCGAKFVIPLDEPEEEEYEEEYEETSEEAAVAPPVPQSRPVSDSTEVDPKDLDQLEEVAETPEDSE